MYTACIEKNPKQPPERARMVECIFNGLYLICCTLSGNYAQRTAPERQSLPPAPGVTTHFSFFFFFNFSKTRSRIWAASWRAQAGGAVGNGGTYGSVSVAATSREVKDLLLLLLRSLSAVTPPGTLHNSEVNCVRRTPSAEVGVGNNRRCSRTKQREREREKNKFSCSACHRLGDAAPGVPVTLPLPANTWWPTAESAADEFGFCVTDGQLSSFPPQTFWILSGWGALPLDYKASGRGLNKLVAIDHIDLWGELQRPVSAAFFTTP